jgi:hypothetical protein
MKYGELEESALKLNELYEELEIKLYGRAVDHGRTCTWIRRRHR